jgi:hypothetical protein
MGEGLNFSNKFMDEVEVDIHRALAEAEVAGLHPLPHDPFDALVFVGTRSAVHTTNAMVAAIRDT